MFQLIPIDKRKGKRCHFCGTTLSVKYEIDINDPVISNKSSKVCCCSRCALLYDDYQREIYNPATHGIITAIHIYLEDGYQPMAELAFAFGGTKIIHWDNIVEREFYAEGINAYTIMFDDRAKLPFENYVRSKANV